MNYKHLFKVVLSLIVAIAITACGSDTPLPLDEEHVMGYLLDVEKANKSLTVKELEQLGSGSDAKKDEIISKMFIAPLNNAGYDLNATLSNTAQRIVAKDLTQEEMTHAMNLINLFPRNSADMLEKNGHITEKTKKLLLKVWKK